MGGTMGKCKMLSTSIMVTDYCTLKCRLCLAYVPYITNKRRLSLGQAREIFKNYFSMVDYVEKFSLTGGEPLTNIEFGDILLELYKYQGQISEIIVITNGTIKLSDEILKKLSISPKIRCIVNNYGDISKYAISNAELLGLHHIKYVLYDESNRYGWVDCRDHGKKHENIDDVEKQASECAFFKGKKYLINHGKMYSCTRSWYRIENKLIPNTEDDYINLLDRDFSSEMSRIHLRKLLARTYSTSCAYCSGRTEQSTLYPAAEQI